MTPTRVSRFKGRWVDKRTVFIHIDSCAHMGLSVAAVGVSTSARKGIAVAMVIGRSEVWLFLHGTEKKTNCNP